MGQPQFLGLFFVAKKWVTLAEEQFAAPIARPTGEGSKLPQRSALWIWVCFKDSSAESNNPHFSHHWKWMIPFDTRCLHPRGALITTYLNKPYFLFTLRPPDLLADSTLPLNAIGVNLARRGGGRGRPWCREEFAWPKNALPPLRLHKSKGERESPNASLSLSSKVINWSLAS